MINLLDFNCRIPSERLDYLAKSASKLFDIDPKAFYKSPVGKYPAGGALSSALRKRRQKETALGDSYLVVNNKRRRSDAGLTIFYLKTIIFILLVVVNK